MAGQVFLSFASAVCEELRNRGYHAINGDVELAYQADPLTGLPTTGFTHEHHIWDVVKVKAIVEDHGEESTFFCPNANSSSNCMPHKKTYRQ